MATREIVQAPGKPAQDAVASSSDGAAPRLRRLQRPYRIARRLGVTLVGSAVLLVGLVLLVTPGPAFVVIPIGLGILALEFEWAARWLDKIKDRIQRVAPAAVTRRWRR
jgi:tellurite resistance protein TerC